jgi:hypothetical protein
MASPAIILSRISDEPADMRHANVSFGDAGAQACVWFAKSIQEGVPRWASKLGIVDAVPDWKIWRRTEAR